MIKYLHIFSDSFYTVKFMEFIDKNFNMLDHAFIIQYNTKLTFKDYYAKYNNFYITNKKLFYNDYKYLFKNSKKIIFHQLNKPLLLTFLLFFHNKIFDKIIWSIWGGDVYFYKYKNTNIKNLIIEFFRNIIIQKIKIVCAYLEEDFEVMKKHYISKARFLKAKYPNPIEFPPIKSEDFKLSKNADDKINILIGNSASVENNHIFLLKLLSKFKDERINIYSILSYGANLEYINEVVQFGKLIYDNKFSPILELMDFNNYLQFLQNIDICVFGHDRQQGLGNLELLIYLGKKAFVKKETTTFNYYSKIGVSIFKTEEITSQSFNAFISFKQNEKENNNNIIKNENDLNILKKQWEDVFNA